VTSHFTGKERDSESGNDYFGARYYGSSMGRFLSPDPGGLVAVNPSFPQTWNMYAYAANNPLIFSDPTGFDCVYYNDSGSGVESIDHSSNSGECQQNGGNWEEGTTFAGWQHYDVASDTWTGASLSNTSVYFYQGSAPGGTPQTYQYLANGDGELVTASTVPCSGNCLSGTSTSISSLQSQLQNGATLYGLLNWAVSQGPSFGPNGVGPAQNDWIGGEGNGWCGAGGAGPPGGNGWACLAHDYNYYVLGANWFRNNYDPGYGKGPQLQKVNQTLCNNVGGAGGVEITLFFSVGPWGCR
jgi:RHS repeat-associated protein